MFFKAIGAANVLTNPAVPLVSWKTPMPLALISFERTSPGYMGCIEVNAIAKTQPKI